MSRYKVTQAFLEGFTVYELRDEETEATAQIIPEIGNNLFSFNVRGVEILSKPERLAFLKNVDFYAFQYGTPILFPPNRVKDGRFEFGNRIYELPINEPPHHHLHGELCVRAWNVIDYGVDDEGAYLTCEFCYADHAEMLEYFPHQLTFLVTYMLNCGELQMSTKIQNEGSTEAPFAFGLHPYFLIPNGEEEILLQVPAVEEWPVTNQAFVTGLPTTTEQCKQLDEGVSITNYPVLGCSLFSLREGKNQCKLTMQNHGYSILYEVSSNLPYLVLFKPDWSNSFSLEPYTYVTDAFNLPHDTQLTGAKGIKPNEIIMIETSISLEK